MSPQCRSRFALAPQWVNHIFRSPTWMPGHHGGMVRHGDGARGLVWHRGGMVHCDGTGGVVLM